MSDDETDAAGKLIDKLTRMIHGDRLVDSLTNPPDGGELRQPDRQAKPWLALGISRATWYRQGKPRYDNSNAHYWRQRNQAETHQRSIRTVQRYTFARRYGIPEINSLAVHHCLPAAILEEIAKCQHDTQRRFADRLLALAKELPRRYEPSGDWGPFELAVLPADPLALKWAARRAFDATSLKFCVRRTRRHDDTTPLQRRRHPSPARHGSLPAQARPNERRPRLVDRSAGANAGPDATVANRRRAR
jgi:hypothetical protein